MKRFLFLVVITCFSLSHTYAQLGVGLRAGYGASSTSQELVTGMSRSLGMDPTFGLMLNYDLDLHFSAGLEFNYSTYSETLEYGADFYPKISTEKKAVQTTPKINYLQIPVFGRATFGDKKYKATLTFGPYVGIGLSGTWVGSPIPKANGTYVVLEGEGGDVKFKAGDFRKLDLGGMVGVGGQYQIGKSGTLFVEARLQLGFIDFYNKQTDLQKSGFNWPENKYLKPSGSWRTANVTIGYFHTFKLPKKKTSNTVKKAGKQRR